MYRTRKRAFYMELTEHFFRLAVRKDITEVQGATVREWHKNTTEWLNEECTAEERELIKSFYTYNQTVRTCNNYTIVDKVHEVAERYADAMGLR